MDKRILNYETLLNVTRDISASKEPGEVHESIVKSVRESLNVKGCALFLLNSKTKELELAAADGLSRDYLNKGPVSALHSIADSLKDGPIAVYDVLDDPRIQYPEEARKEGIASILSAPIKVRDRAVGALRVYTSEPWEFTLDDVNFVQALAQLAGMRNELAQIYTTMVNSIDLLKMKNYENRPVSEAGTA